MQVFHYLADQLKEEPLFECSRYELDQSVGAVYNDVDYDPIALLHGDDQMPFCFSQTSNVGESNVTYADTSNVIREGVEHAVLEADKNEGIAYEDIVFDSCCFQVEGCSSDESYLEKVYRIISGDEEAWENLKISKKAMKIFRMRFNNNWEGLDTVYDAWLLIKGKSRIAFPNEAFMKRYPNFHDIISSKSEMFKFIVSDDGEEDDEDEARFACGQINRHNFESSSDSESSSSSSQSSSSSTESMCSLSLIPQQRQSSESESEGIRRETVKKKRRIFESSSDSETETKDIKPFKLKRMESDVIDLCSESDTTEEERKPDILFKQSSFSEVIEITSD